MNEFLEKVILDNSIRSYLAVLAVILFVLVFKKFLSQWIASVLFIFVKRHWKTVPKNAFISLMIKPLAWFITISIAIFAIDKLTFPNLFLVKIYGHPTDEILDKTGKCLIIIFFTWFVTSLIDFIALILEQKASLTKDKSDDQLIVFFRDFFKVIITILGILLIIKAGFNQKIGNLLTGLSIVGAAMALAAKESLENLIASFIIFFDKPFFTGDTLKVNNVTGTVEHIGLRSTRIRTIDRSLVTVPNKQMVDYVVDNLSVRTERRAEIKLEFTVSSSTADIEKFMKETELLLAKSREQVSAYAVFLTDFSKNGITINIEYFTKNVSMDAFNNLKQSVNISLKKMVEDLKLELVSSETDINIFNRDPGAGIANSQPII